MLSFVNNRVLNRPHRPRCPILVKFCKEIGYEWPDLPEPDLEPNEENQDGEIGEEGDEEEVWDEDEVWDENDWDDWEGWETELECENAVVEGAGTSSTADGSVPTPPAQPSQPESHPALPGHLPSPHPKPIASPSLVTPEPRGIVPKEMTPEAVDVSCKHIRYI